MSGIIQNCTHCDEAALPPLYLESDSDRLHPFCCEGCMTVYHIIHEKGLNAYYDIKRDSISLKRRAPVDQRVTQFQYLDHEDFLKEYSYLDVNNFQTMEIYLEGIHCLACLWLIEKLPEFLPNIQSCKLDIDKSVVTVKIQKNGKFSQVAKELNQLGYKPHPLKRNQEVVNLRIKEERTSLLRIGIAGAAAGNIMIYAVSLYGGAEGEFAHLFNLLTVLFAIPVLTFSALPFYQNAWNAVKNKTLSIDIPISISLLVGAFMGVYNLIIGVPDNYFDSLTTLVFLLLLSRYFLSKIQEKGFSASDLHFFYQTESVFVSNKETPVKFVETHPKFIKDKDVLKIKPGDFFPADCVILKGTSNINMSLLTGEVHPIRVDVGENVFSGTQNVDGELLVEVIKAPENSRLGMILKNVEDGWSLRSKIVNLTNKISKYFTLAVFILSAVLFFYLLKNHGLKHALECAITLLIVTCPCALALAVPLTFTRALSKASENGIIIKSDEVIEKISKIQHVFLDKTGTITYGKLKIVNFTILRTPKIRIEDIILNLEKDSKHPVALALRDFIKGSDALSVEVKNFKETLGVGVSGTINEIHYEIRKNGIFEDDSIVASFEVKDIVRSESKSVIEKMINRGIQLTVLSGDKKEVVQKIAADVSLNPHAALYGLSPEDKSRIIKSTPNSMMVGDGANDAIALSHSSVGVAVMGAMDISLRAADVYLTTPGLESIEKLFILSQETMKVIRRNLVLSLIYNSISVIAAFVGVINPLIAAVIMPVSSLTVLFSSLIGTKRLRALWK